MMNARIRNKRPLLLERHSSVFTQLFAEIRRHSEQSLSGDMSRTEPGALATLLVADDGWCSTCTICGLAGNIMLCEFGCKDSESPAVCCLAYHPSCLGLSKPPKEQFVCPRHGALSTIPARKLPQKALNCILRCGPKSGVIKTGRPKKYKKEQVERMLSLLEAGLETAIPDYVKTNDSARAAAKAAAPKKCSGVEIIDADGCCVLCGGGGADLLCTFLCPPATPEDETGDTISICGCMFHSRCVQSSDEAQPAPPGGVCLSPFTCPLHPCPCDRSSINIRWSPRAVKWALAFDPVSSHHLLFGSRGLVAMYQGWNTHCSICMRGESAGEPLLRCKAGLPPSDQLLLKRSSDERVGEAMNAELGLFCVCPSAYHLKCLVNRANGHSTLDVTPNNFICPLHSNASISTQ